MAGESCGFSVRSNHAEASDLRIEAMQVAKKLWCAVLARSEGLRSFMDMWSRTTIYKNHVIFMLM